MKSRGDVDKSASTITFETVLNLLEKNVGGACFTAAFGAQIFLTHLGFDCYVTHTFIENRPGFQILHFLLVVKDLEKEGDLHLIDFGTRLSPLNQPIPLHLLAEEGQESEKYESFYMYNKFVRRGDDIFRLTGKIGSNSDPFFFYGIKAVPARCGSISDDGVNLNFEKFPKADKPKLSESEKSEAAKKAGRFWFSQFHVVGFPEGKVCVFRNTEWMHQDELNGEIKRVIIDNKDEYIDKLAQCYPSYEREIIESTINSIWDGVIQPRA